MKIFFLAQVDMSTTEAGVVHVVDLADAMRKAGHAVDLVVFSERPSVVKEKRGMKVFVMPSWACFWFLKGLIINIVALYVLLRGGVSGHDVMYARYSPNIALPIRFFSGRMRVWVEINGISWDEEQHIKRSWADAGRIYAARALERIAYKKADKYVCVTPKVGNFVVEKYGVKKERVTIAANGVDVDAYRPLDKKACRNKLGMEEERVYVGFIGNFISWQGIDTLLEALPEVMKQLGDVRAVIVGGGQRFEEYRRLAAAHGIADKVLFPGFVHKDAAPEWINCFDVGVVLKKPIMSGYSPLKLYSYMACGLPVLATGTEGFEPVEEHKAGILVPYGNKDVLVNALLRLCGDESLRKTFGVNARRCAVEEFSWGATVRKICGNTNTAG